MPGVLEDYLSGEVPVSSVISSGISLEFYEEVFKFCKEIKELLVLEEDIRKPHDQNLSDFLFDLSAFLLELDCPYDEITCGSLESRFDSEEKCQLLLEYLVNELRVARLTASRNLSSGKNKVEVNKPLTQVIASALSTCDVQTPSKETQIIISLRAAAEKRLATAAKKPVPLLNTTLDDKKIESISQVCEILRRDFHNRLVLLSRRFEVTVNSFLWSDTVKQHADKIRDELTAGRTFVDGVKSNCDIAHLMAASDRLLELHSASSAKYRQNTKSNEHPLLKAEVTLDRGGRVTGQELTKIVTNERQDYRGGHRGGGGNRGRGGHQRGGFNNRGRGRGGWRGQSHEDMVRKEHSNKMDHS